MTIRPNENGPTADPEYKRGHAAGMKAATSMTTPDLAKLSRFGAPPSQRSDAYATGYGVGLAQADFDRTYPWCIPGWGRLI